MLVFDTADKKRFGEFCQTVLKDWTAAALGGLIVHAPEELNQAYEIWRAVAPPVKGPSDETEAEWQAYYDRKISISASLEDGSTVYEKLDCCAALYSAVCDGLTTFLKEL